MEMTATLAVEAPPSVTCASVVSRESVRIAFLIAAMNNLDIEAADIGNACLNAPPRETIYIKCGPEFGPELQGRHTIIVRALCGLKSLGASWRAFLALVLEEDLNFTMCRANNDVWFKPAKKADGTRCCVCVLVHTDDHLCVAEHPKATLDKLDQHFLVTRVLRQTKDLLGCRDRHSHLRGRVRENSLDDGFTDLCQRVNSKRQGTPRKATSGIEIKSVLTTSNQLCPRTGRIPTLR